MEANWTISEIFQKSWDSIKSNVAFVAGLTLVYTFGVWVMNLIPFAGWIATGPMMAGYIQCLLKIRKSETISYQDFFWGFLDLNRLAQLALLNIIVFMGTMVGTLLLVIPGVWWAIATYLSSTHYILYGGDAIASVKKSIEIIRPHWFKYLGFVLALALLNIVGAICFLVGILVTIPVSIFSSVILLESIQNASRTLTDK